MSSSTIFIVGAGAIGRALSVFLQEEGKQVILVRGSVDHKPERQNTITVLDQDNEQYQQTIKTTTFSNLKHIDGIVLIAVKTFANDSIAKKLNQIDGYFPIVLLQNGLNIEEPFSSFDEVYRCVLFSTSQITGDDTVTFKAVKDSPVGRIHGDKPRQKMIVDEISTPYFGFRSESNILKFAWSKTIINCAFNSICPLLESDNGIFHRNSEAAQLAITIIRECVALSRKYDIHLNADDILDKLMLISKRSDGQLISTYEDIRRGRRTEIDSLNLELSRLAEEAGTRDLVSNTKLLGDLIRVKSELNMA